MEPYQCIKHADCYVDINDAYFRLYREGKYVYAKAAIVQLLENCAALWTPIPYSRFRLIGQALFVGRTRFKKGIAELIAQGHVLQQGNTYKLNIPVVQQALDEQGPRPSEDNFLM